MKLVFATHNDNKAAEIQKLMPPGIRVVTLNDIGCHDEIPETATTLEGNALIKARHVWTNYGLNCFADDTGLEVAALNGEPGVYSARYAGIEKNAQANMELLLKKMEGKLERQAQFRTVIALVVDGRETLFEGVVTGDLTTTKSGAEGFGYDPIFKPEGNSKTFAEMTMDEKNKISHRGRAIRKLVDFLAAG